MGRTGVECTVSCKRRRHTETNALIVSALVQGARNAPDRFDNVFGLFVSAAHPVPLLGFTSI